MVKKFMPEEPVSKKTMMRGAVLISPDGRYGQVDASTYRDRAVEYGVAGPIMAYLDHIFSGHEKEDEKQADRFSANFTTMARQRRIIDQDTAVAGHFFFLPKGKFISDLLMDYVDRVSGRHGYKKMDIPLVFRREGSKATTDLTEKFMTGGGGPNGERMVGLTSGTYFRYAGDPVLFPWVAAKSPLTERDLPMRLYTPGVTLRHELGGELRGLERSVAFTLTDYHAFADPKKDLVEYLNVHAMNSEVMRMLCGDGWFLNLDVVEEFFNGNTETIVEAVKRAGVPAVAKLMEARTHYYSIQNQYRVSLSDGSSTQVANLQFDRVNGESFGVRVRREDGTAGHATIIHGAQYGRVEKVLTYLMDRAAADTKAGRPPSFPFWLSPTQVRLIGIKPEHSDYVVNNLLPRLRGAGIRVDYDNRKNKDFRKRVGNAEEDWVPYVLVVGDNEVSSGGLKVRDRKTGQVTDKNVDEFVKMLQDEQNGMPFRPLPCEEDVSKRSLMF